MCILRRFGKGIKKTLKDQTHSKDGVSPFLISDKSRRIILCTFVQLGDFISSDLPFFFHIELKCDIDL